MTQVQTPVRSSTMGCDFYTYLVTVIQFKNADGKLLKHHETGEYERHYYHYCDDEVDPDLDAPVSLSDNIQAMMNQMCRAYGERVLFADGEWTCQPAGKERILALCTEHGVSADSLVRVYKVKSGQLR